MNLYPLLLFLHVSAAIALFIGTGVWVIGILAITRARQVAQVRALADLLLIVRTVVPASALLVIVAGAAMTQIAWSFRAPWILATLASLLLIGPFGTWVIDPRVRHVARLAHSLPDGPLPVSLATSAHDPVLCAGLPIQMTMLLAGGKAAQLGVLLRARFPVPDGFCVTTAAYARMAHDAHLDPSLEVLAALPPGDTAHLAMLAGDLRSAILQTPVPDDVAGGLLDAYRRLPSGVHTPVAVRSSATAEDLPDASFAGQQETSLNVIGAEALLAAVQRCWASLWTERGVQYRAQLGSDPRAVRAETDS
jgi:hypothetical protein